MKSLRKLSKVNLTSIEKLKAIEKIKNLKNKKQLQIDVKQRLYILKRIGECTYKDVRKLQLGF